MVTIKQVEKPSVPRKAGNGADPDPEAVELLVLDWDEWATKEVPPREMIMEPFFPQKGLVELYSDRGIGKTFLGLGIAVAISTGTPLLRWTVPKPRRVLYVDGEMAFSDLQERAKWMVEALETPPEPGFLQLLSADLHANGLPDLATSKGQKCVNAALGLGTPDQADLLILDNLSVLTSTGSESSDQDWQSMQNWLLSLRRSGVSVLFMHHAGKSGKQRGTSKREDILDTVIKLDRLIVRTAKGAAFTISYEKHRRFFGSDAIPFKAHFEERNGVGYWAVIVPESERIAALHAEGLSERAIAEALGIDKSKVHRVLSALKDL